MNLKHIETKTNNLTIIARITPALLFVSCLAIVIIFILLAQHAQPSSDDFCMASGVNKSGLIRHLWEHYFEWSGRYTGNALYAVYPVIFDLFGAYKFIPALLLPALLTATAFFLSTVFRITLFCRFVWLVSFCFVCIFLLGLMSPASSLYWMAGAFTYQTANILLLVLLGLMIQLVDRQHESKNYTHLLAVLLIIMALAIGTNETSMLALTGLSLFMLIFHVRSGRAKLKPWLAIFLLALACFSIVYLSPGNTVRAADFPLRHDLARSVKGSLAVGFSILWIWVSNPLLIVSSLLAPFAIAKLDRLSDRALTVSRMNIIILAAITLMIPLVLQFPAWWSMGGWPPARTVDVIYFLFLVCWYITVGAISLHYLHSGKWKLLKQAESSIRSIVIILLSLAFTVTAIGGKSYQLALNDLLHHARPYHEYLNARYQQIEQAKANDAAYLVVPDYHRQLPRTIYFNDIMHNPEHWRNVCYADYFGLQKVSRGER